jgi:hypothetical protein
MRRIIEWLFAEPYFPFLELVLREREQEIREWKEGEVGDIQTGQD